MLDGAVEAIPLFALAELSFALSLFDGNKHQAWLMSNLNAIESRLAQEYNIVYLQEDGELLTVHFLLTPDEIDESEKDPLHAAAIERLRLIRQLFPKYEKYGSQGYGHKLGPFKFKFDSTHKSGTNKTHLVPQLATRMNGIAIGIGRNQYRPDDWLQYIHSILEIRKLIVTCLEHLRPGLGKYLERTNPVNIGTEYINKSDWQRCFILLSAPPDLPQAAVDRWGFVGENFSEMALGIDRQRYVPSAIALRKYEAYLKTQSRYFASIHNFILQAVDVSVTNFNLSKQPPTANRQAIVEALDRAGIKTDRGHLSTYNLWEARAVLEGYQEEFRQLLGNLIDPEVLTDLVQNETDLLSQVWPLWYFYAYEPQLIVPRALHRVPRKVQDEKSRIDRLIQQAIGKISTEDVIIERISTELKWENSHAIWISLDLQDPTTLYQVFESLLTSLQTLLSPIKPKELARYVIQENHQYVVVIPTVCGRMMNDNAWVLFSASTIFRESSLNEENWFLYIFKPLPTEIREQLGLQAWDLPEIEQANQLLVTIGSLFIVATQVSELNDLPSASDAGRRSCKSTFSTPRKCLANSFMLLLLALTAYLTISTHYPKLSGINALICWKLY